MVESLVFAWVALAECDHSLPKLNGSHPSGATHPIKSQSRMHALFPDEPFNPGS